MDVNQILSMLPVNLLRELAIETEVNRYAKKLQGELIFKLLLHCILSHKDNSLRTMESAYESIGFNLLNAGRKKQHIRYSSISERLSSIDPAYFEKIYQTCITIYGRDMKESATSFIRFDSTIVALSSKLLNVGYRLPGSAAQVRQLKFTIGFSELPEIVHLYTEQKHTSENVTLKQTILFYQPDKAHTIRIFDKGITSRKTHDELTAKKIPFISRMSVNSKFETKTANLLSTPFETESLIISSDNWIYLFGQSGKAKYPVRCIRAIRKTTKEEVAFIANIGDLSVSEITELYCIFRAMYTTFSAAKYTARVKFVI